MRGAGLHLQKVVQKNCLGCLDTFPGEEAEDQSLVERMVGREGRVL